MYDSGFETYRTVTPDEYQSVLRNGLVILDANVLLHLYRYHSGTRKDLMEILAAIKDHLWIPHQVMQEFWQGRSGVIDGRAKEIEEVISGLHTSGLQLGEGVSKWANRIGLPQREKARILDRIESTIKYTADIVTVLSAADTAEDIRDTDRDSVLVTLEPILDGSIGRPLMPDVAREAKKEALQRISDKRAPGWRDANKKENKEGDYFVWYQSLQEAKRRGLDVLFVTDDAKPDWWRIEHGETKGPLAELVHEMREIANVRLFMTRPETLLLHAKDVLGKDVSSDSVRDVQRVSTQVDLQWNSETVPDLHPNPLRARTGREFMECLTQFRIYAGNRSPRQISEHSGGRIIASSVARILREGIMPNRLELVDAMVQGMGGTDLDRADFANAWRRLHMGQSVDSTRPDITPVPDQLD
jgi:hypothetical protein